MGDRLYIVMYHYTRDLRHCRYPRIKGLDLPLFRRQLDFFQDRFNVVTMEMVIEAANNGGSLPDRALLMTFDDGYIDNYTVAFPLLRERHMQGSFFIPGKTVARDELLDVNKIHFLLASEGTPVLLRELCERMDYYRGGEYGYPSNEELMAEYGVANRFDDGDTIFIKRMLQTALPADVRRMILDEMFQRHIGLPEKSFARELYMNHDQIRLMRSAGMFIGFHGFDHYWLANLGEEEMRRDIDQGLDVISPYIDRDAWVMNYPYGNYNPQVCEYARQKGACLGLTTEVRVARLRADDAMILPRLDCNDFPPKSDNWRRIGIG